MKQLFNAWFSKKKSASATIKPYPSARHLISDILSEGGRKNTFYALFEVDLTQACENIKRYTKIHRKPISLTTYIVKVFANAVSEHKALQTYRYGRSRLMMFNEVDVMMTVEREVQGELMPIFHIVRDANQASLESIAGGIQYKKTAPFTARPRPLSRTVRYFTKMPSWIRKLVWVLMLRRPYFIKRYMGTVAVSATSSFASSGRMVFLSRSPITLLSIGSGRTQTLIIDEVPKECYLVQMCLTVDHDVVDGAPLSRFIERFKQLLQQPDEMCG